MVGFMVAPPPDEQDDRHSIASVHSIHSIASTVATTTSLASRIRDLNLDFGDKLVEADVESKDAERAAAQSPLAEESEEERTEATGIAAFEGECCRVEDLSISHTLHLLQRDPPLQVCCRLFERRSHPPLPLKRLTMLQVEDFRQHGYVVLDNFISKEAAARIKAEAMRLAQQGVLEVFCTSATLQIGWAAVPGVSVFGSRCRVAAAHAAAVIWLPGVLGSTTSSMIAEVSAPDHDTYSLDGISLAESEAERQGFEWVESEGGDMALDIAPLAGRLLLMLSGAVEHALLPGGLAGSSSSSSTGSSDNVFLRAWCS
eukprot:gene10588-10746_t